MRTTRRAFLRLSGAATGGAAFHIAPPGSFGKNAPGNRISVGVVGLGGMGAADLDALLGMDGVTVRCVCDVNRAKAYAARERVDRHYGSRVCVAEADYRAVCERPDLDAVVIATPDHTHAAVGLSAAAGGKDIYGEPPFTHTLREGRELVEAVARGGRVYQAGSWQRSQTTFRHASDVVREGALGRLARVEVGLPGGGRGPSGGTCSAAVLQSGLDGRAACDYHWRWVSAWGGGTLAEWIGHYGDTALWGAGLEETGPVRVEGAGEFPSDGLYDTATSFAFECLFGNGLVLAVADGGRLEKGVGVRWIGQSGEWLWVTRGGVEASSPETLREIARRSGKGEPSGCGAALARHLRNFIDCVRTRETAWAPAESAHRAASLSHLGDLAMRSVRVVSFDPRSERVL